MLRDISLNQMQTRNQILQANLDKAIRLNRMYQSEDFKAVLLPALKQASLVKWLDPKDPNFNLNYQLAYSKAEAYRELLNMFEGADAIIQKSKLELGQPEKSWQTGK